MNKQTPAFPIHPSMRSSASADQREAEGMTLRQWYAGLAIPMAWDLERDNPTHTLNGEPTYRGVAERAVLMADALIKAESEA